MASDGVYKYSVVAKGIDDRVEYKAKVHMQHVDHQVELTLRSPRNVTISNCI
jgi:hypothetical protein